MTLTIEDLKTMKPSDAVEQALTENPGVGYRWVNGAWPLQETYGGVCPACLLAHSLGFDSFSKLDFPAPQAMIDAAKGDELTYGKALSNITIHTESWPEAIERLRSLGL